jgi:putative cardiolipin synthase
VTGRCRAPEDIAHGACSEVEPHAAAGTRSGDVRRRGAGNAVNRASACALILVASWLAGCATLPPPSGRTESHAFVHTEDTRLGRAVAPRVAANPGKTGIHPLTLPADAFAARTLLADAAERSVDAQYYLWHGDQAGYLLFEALHRAAERGVRVRLLLDDQNTQGLDETLAELDAHPHIEVRIYNPFIHRRARLANYLTDFARANRRMHNKAFIADNQVAVVGGRNIANEYMGAGNDVVFADLDVIAVGSAVGDIEKEFDTYWNSASAYPAAQVLSTQAIDPNDLLQKFARARSDPESTIYIEHVRNTPLLSEIVAGRLALEWTDAVLVHDDPSKTVDTTDRRDGLLLPTLLDAMGKPVKSFDLISPYFVPGDKGTEALVALAKSAVRVRVLTNSLAATDVMAVHAGYAKRRRELVQAGIMLYELKASAGEDDPEHKARFGSSASSSLHAKTFAVDEDRVFVGSFNFDPRSAYVNTEMGLVIRSPLLAQQLAAAFDTTIPKIAYEVRLTSEGALEWIDRAPGGVRRFDVDPGTSLGKRLLVEFLSALPIDSLL